MAPYLERWLEELVATPGMTGIDDLASARRTLLDDALRAVPIVTQVAGSVVDVGSGGGSPGVPLAVTFPERPFTLLEAQRRKCDFLERATSTLANVEVVWGRAEEQSIDSYGVALAKALAKPPVAAELCLPLVALDGVALLWLGESADLDAVEKVSNQLGARLERDLGGLVVLRKVNPTPTGFPRRPGMAKKRPLA
ncbi:MAG TPA: RsmG family class I SAM-dependent methyltransferase [Gaiellaceae bacterium]